MAWRWLPWRAIVRRAARAYGVIDPLTVAARMRRFSQPSEVAEPLELLRAGIVFHARGLINTKAIQHNLDWVWPYWVVRQFDPSDASFIPRAFSFSHVNLTHRNWTAVGLPDCSAYPIVDPRGLWTPLHDGWSVDCWIVGPHGDALLPSRCDRVSQWQTGGDGLGVETVATDDHRRLHTRATVVRMGGRAHAVLDLDGEGSANDRLVVAVRPYNPEGVQFIDRLEPLTEAGGFRINRTTDLTLEPAPEAVRLHRYDEGDVFHGLDRSDGRDGGVDCSVGMATGAAVYSLAHGRRTVRLAVALEEAPPPPAERCSWAEAHRGCARATLPEPGLQALFDTARTTLVLHSVDEIVPGPYTYRRFWFRDACLITHALLAGGYIERVRAALERFPERQRATGYFQSQEGEWDSNGQVLWAYGRFQAMTGEALPERWLDAIDRGVRWIARKRIAADAGAGTGGLLPAGFSAEHLGPNDYYYWDDWWAIAGLLEAERVLRAQGRARAADRAGREAASLRDAVHASLEGIPAERTGGAMPAAPGRRMDAGAIGSLVADYPLRLLAPGDRWTMHTIDYLERHSFHGGGFFQDMIHSGINIYLTLAMAQTFLRSRDARYRDLITAVADLASPTGQWPEAINPLTGGGCMGDGQHGWAAAEWVMMIRSLFVREEGNTLMLGSGIFPEWLDQKGPLSFGPTLVPGGAVTVTFMPLDNGLELVVDACEQSRPIACTAAVPGYRPQHLDTSRGGCFLEPV